MAPKGDDNSTLDDYHYDAKSGMLLTTQGMNIPTTSKGYVQALFGKDNAVWTDGGAGTAAFGNAITVKFSFDDVSWANYYNWGGASDLDATQEAAARSAMAMWANAANITFVESSATDAQIAFHEYNIPNAAGVALTWSANDDGMGKSDRIVKSEVCTDDANTGYTAGGYGYLTFIHEVGHALGIKHPGNYNAGGGGADAPYLSTFKLVDSRDFTVMSYNGGAITGANHPTTPMIYDIAAIQYLYGANTSYNAGNTTYTMASTLNAFCRWDGAGVDTLDASSYASGAILDLREGEAYVTRVGSSYSWNAFGCNIENATGGNGNDTLYGNALGNTLTGGTGNDTLAGGSGNDTLAGGSGSDNYIFSLNDGNDTVTDSDSSGAIVVDGVALSGTAFLTGAGAYMLVGSSAAFSLAVSGSTGILTTTAGSTQITLNNFSSGAYGITLGNSQVSITAGTSANNTLTDAAGNQVIFGLSGNDKMSSYVGVDSLYGGAGDDNITLWGSTATAAYGDDGKDTITTKGVGNIANGGAGDDKITGSAASQTLNGDAGKDAITGGGAGTVINGGADDDTLTLTIAGATANGGDGIDKISAKVVAATMNGDAGNDILTGADGNDTINGGADNDTIKSMKGNDVIDGGIGIDIIYGGLGNDTMTGGAGVDTFYFEKSNNGVDTITDFTVGEDILRYTKTTTEAAVIAAATESGGDTTITINGATVILEDVTIAELTGHEFVW
ncbi:MAG: M10 family metallopeptidase C-terminal domain-containing protein [Alphaproteobacteria bacterium]|nr:M10 family metallopeptidase C-terminal domain-containing protein [Alphaproteobacteria bacterium]